jgi:hypothetical protein
VFGQNSPNVFIGNIIIGMNDLISQPDDSDSICDGEFGLLVKNPSNGFANNFQISLDASLQKKISLVADKVMCLPVEIAFNFIDGAINVI